MRAKLTSRVVWISVNNKADPHPRYQGRGLCIALWRILERRDGHRVVVPLPIEVVENERNFLEMGGANGSGESIGYDIENI